MLYTCIKLGEVFEDLKQSEATLHTYISDNSQEIELHRKKPCVVICPGGGYGFTSDREAEPIALSFMAAGYNAFVIRYSISPVRYPQQLLELSAAVAYIRRMADSWDIDCERIAVCGFSAGGHLAASLGTLWNEPFIAKELGLEQEENKPNRLILAYPVISSGEYAHRGSFVNLLGEDASEELIDALSLETRVGAHTPETFIWHTFTDTAVPVENSLLFAQALSKHKVPFELHIYPKGGHGLSLCDQRTAAPTMPEFVQPHVGTWFPLVLEWLALN